MQIGPRLLRLAELCQRRDAVSIMTGTHTDTVARSTRLPIAVRDFGGSGLPIVLIHGLGRSLADWIHFAPLLTARHRVIAVDVRGHGASGDGPWSWEAATDDMAAVVEYLGLSAPAVAGHSLGALIAAVWAERHPECPGAINGDTRRPRPSAGRQGPIVGPLSTIARR